MVENSTAVSAVSERIPVGISSCLLGERVRYDGGHKHHSYIEQTLGRYFEFRPFCPELAIGLGVPRRPIHLVRRGDEIACVDTGDASREYTGQLEQCADDQRDWHRELCGYILKGGSPSCGTEGVKVHAGEQYVAEGRGIYAARLMANFPDLPVEEEGRLGDPGLRANFVRRVCVMRRWKALCDEGLTVAGLIDFHARHKLILLSHCQRSYRQLGPLVASARADNLQAVAGDYIHRFMQALARPATRGNHVNVLQHIRGYLKQELEAGDRAELNEAIEQYRTGQVPLTVPLTLLNHHFRRHPDPFIQRSWYMQPHPLESGNF